MDGDGMKHFIKSIGLIFITLVLSSCTAINLINELSGNISTPVELAVSTYVTASMRLDSPDNEGICENGIQATLTVLDDGFTMSSPRIASDDYAHDTDAIYDEFTKPPPRTNVDALFYTQQSEKSYGQNTWVRYEAHCYKSNDVHGYIKFEAKLVENNLKTNRRVVDARHFTNGYTDKDCVGANDFPAINILEQVEPVPCVDSTYLVKTN